MARVTTQILKQTFEIFRNTYPDKAVARRLRLDYYNPGDSDRPWRVVECMEGGGERDIFGAARRSTREMYSALSFAIEVVRGGAE